jgi:hypothetical protein
MMAITHAGHEVSGQHTPLLPNISFYQTLIRHLSACLRLRRGKHGKIVPDVSLDGKIGECG